MFLRQKMLLGQSIGICAGLAAFLADFVVMAGPPAEAMLQSHRAVYDMQLGEADERSGIAGLTGLMVYDFTGSPCEGYSVNFRFVTEFQDALGDIQVTDLQSTTFEAIEAQSYQFLSKTYVDQELVEETRGTAKAGSGAKTIKLKKPSEQTLDIDGEVLFPTEHMLTVLAAANNGVRFLAADVYDGTETGDKVYGTATVIGMKAEVAKTGPSDESVLTSSFESLGYWPVTVAYFDTETKGGGEQIPVYQFSYWLFENGISRNLLLDYGDFSIKGKLVDLEIYEQSACDDRLAE